MKKVVCELLPKSSFVGWHNFSINHVGRVYEWNTFLNIIRLMKHTAERTS